MRKPKPVESLEPLAEKLRAVRLWKQMTEQELLPLVCPAVNDRRRALIAQWENADSEPGRQILIRYAELAEISLEQLMVDRIVLPAHITSDRVPTAVDCRADATTVSDAPRGDASSAPKNEPADTATDGDDGTPVDEDDTDSDEPMPLSFIIGEAPTEAITLKLPVETIDDLHHTYLQFLSELPRSSRSAVSLDGMVFLCLNAFLKKDKRYEGKSLFAESVEIHHRILSRIRHRTDEKAPGQKAVTKVNFRRAAKNLFKAGGKGF